MEMAKTYNPSEFEREIYEEWEREGCFKAHVDAEKLPFTIVIPPPNITGQLHMGHKYKSYFPKVSCKEPA